MFSVKLAGLPVRICNRCPETQAFCADYLTKEEPLITLDVTDEVLAKEQALATESISAAYGECLAVYRLLGEQLPLWDGCIFHGAAIAFDGKAYLFAAPSGTGKTTHISYWKKAFGHRVSIVNGDKPILRYLDGVLYAWGTPWAGKESLHRNVGVPVGGICFLSRGETDRIVPAEASSCVAAALSQIYLPQGQEAMDKTLTLLDRILRDVPLWKLECTKDIHSAFVAKEGMIGK